MAFENAYVNSIRYAISQCKNNIKHSDTENIITAIEGGNTISSSSQKRLANALRKLINEDYKELENKLDTYNSLVDYMEKYKNLQKENEDLRRTIRNLQSSQYKEETDKICKYDDDGNEYYEDVIKQVEDPSVTSEINRCYSKIRENENQMDRDSTYVKNKLGM